MMSNKTITVDHLYRVEGHGGIRVEVDGKTVIDVRMEIFEGSRFFEALIRGRSYKDIPMIMCRICAICSSSHRVVAIKAVEKALGMKVSGQTEFLRELLILGEIIESHSLHLFCLAAPDFLKLSGIIEMADSHMELVKMGLGIKKLGNDVQELMGGRKIHPINAEIGGFSRVPDLNRLLDLRGRVEEGLPMAAKALDFIESITKENLTSSSSIFSALMDNNRSYSYSGDLIRLSNGETLPVEDYRTVCNEKVVSYSNAKHSLYKGKPVMVGSLARIYLNRATLSGVSADTMKRLETSFDPSNILWNNLAQAVEIQQAMHRIIEIIDLMANEGYKEEELVKAVAGAGRGTAATEAPRGTLYHSYEIDDAGMVVDADVITPTAINLENMEKDIRAAAERFIDDPEEELKTKLEKVVRAYDPCISCSVHLVDVTKR